MLIRSAQLYQADLSAAHHRDALLLNTLKEQGAHDLIPYLEGSERESLTAVPGPHRFGQPASY